MRAAGDRLAVSEIARDLKISPATVCRWCLKGVRGHRLPSHMIGGRRFVCPSDLQDFMHTINTEALPVSEGSRVPSKRTRPLPAVKSRVRRRLQPRRRRG